MKVLPLNDFEAAGKAVMAFLRERLGFELWMLTRVDGDDWIVLQADDQGYGVAPGRVFRWADSFCAAMVAGSGPNVAPCSRDIPSYASAAISKVVPIQAYIGLPLWNSDGSLFGTLCAIDPEPQSPEIIEEQALLELLAELLSGLLQVELRAAAESRRAEQLAREAESDRLTGLLNRRGWDRVLASEEERCRRYGHGAAITVVDIDGLKVTNDSEGHAAGDALIRHAADALRRAARASDVIARLGGDEFGILCVECDRAGAEVMLERVRQALAEHDVEASVGIARRAPGEGLVVACNRADERMYEDKRVRKAVAADEG